MKSWTVLEISTSGGRVENRELQLLVRSNHKYSSGRQRNALRVSLCRIDHSIGFGYLPVLVVDYNERKLFGRVQFAIGLNILNPAGVHVGVVARQRNHLDTTLFKLGTELSRSGKLLSISKIE